MAGPYEVRTPDGGTHGPVAMPQLVQWWKQGLIPIGAVVVDQATGASHEPARLLAHVGPAATIAPRVHGDPTLVGLMIPSNGFALASYYIGVFTPLALLLFCLPAVFAGVAAVSLGVIGLLRARANPQLRGRKHCWAGIILGAVFGLLGVAGTIWWLLGFYGLY